MAEKQNRLKPPILFLSVPESLRGQVENLAGDSANDFSINPDIPIPVEVPEGETELDLQELSWEMIVAGMLRVIADDIEKIEWIDYYRRFVLAVRPGIMGEFNEAAILKARNGDFDLALEILDTLRGLFPASAVVMLNRALVLEERASLLKRHRPDWHETREALSKAESAYTEVAARHPAFAPVHFNAGFFCLGQQDFRRARECFALYIEYADDAEKKEKSESIVKDIDKNGLDDESFYNAYTFMRQGETGCEEQAMPHIRDFIERYPSVWNGWFMLGKALRRLCRWQDAIAAFSKAIELGGGNSETRNYLAICLDASGDLKGARRELETALRDDPESADIISNLGVIAAKEGRLEEAADFFRIVLELDPDAERANHFLQYGTPFP